MPRIRKSGDGGLYFDAKRGLWIGVVDIGFNQSGGRKQKRVTSKSQSAARAKLNQLKSEIAAHGSPLGNQTVAEWGAFWLDGYKLKKPQTYRTYQSLLNMWVIPAIGRKNVKDVRPSDLRRVYDALRDAGKSSSTALKVHNMLSGMFEGARLERLVSANVVKDIRPPKAAKAQRGTLSPSETLRILETASFLEDGSKWILSLYAGIRQGERLGATIDSVDLNSGMFTVQWNMVEGNYQHGCGGGCGRRHAGHCPKRRLLIPEGVDYRRLSGRLLLVPPKSGETRTFPLPPKIAEMLEVQVSRMAGQPNPYGLLWPAVNGEPMTAREDQEQWRALLVSAGVERPEATTHWARHTAISDFTAAGVPERVIGEIVGHKSAGVTGRYQHVSSRDAVEAMVKLGQRREVDR